VMVAVVPAAVRSFENGRPPEVAAWGLTLGSLAFVPTALQGVINVRFPAGIPSGRGGQILDRMLTWGIVLTLSGGVLGDNTTRALVPGATRVVDGTPIVAVGNLMAMGVPVVIGLGVVAGIGVVVRCIHARGLERKQLSWRAAGVAYAFILFPLAVTDRLPDWANDLDPLVFVITLVVPVLRYDLWAIDTLIRRSAARTLSSSRSVVGSMVSVTAEMLRLPYVAVHRGGQDLATTGKPTGEVEVWPLVHEGATVGVLSAASRLDRATLDQQDRQVLATLAQLIAASVSAEALTADLQEARLRLVTAREEERRRLRRDLHDGLGPLLTGLGLNLDAARSTLSSNPAGAEAYLAKAKDASSQVITSLREVVHGLRPPALDELGFVGALRLQLDRIAGGSGLTVQIAAPDDLTLPAAVEVAAFHTIAEAITNVVRHSDATVVHVAVSREPSRLTVTVADNGRATPDWLPGVGLRSMRERAEELAGSLRATSGTAGGEVHVTYPLTTVSTVA